MGLSRQAGFRAWTRAEVQDLLTPVSRSTEDLGRFAATPEQRAYVEGYRDALRAVADAFGVELDALPVAGWTVGTR